MAVRAQLKRQLGRATALSFVLAAVGSVVIPLSASAQFAQPLQEPPTQNGGVPMPEIPGSGPTPKTEITGDGTGQPPLAPTGVANTGPTTPFPQGVGNDRTEVYIYDNTAGRIVPQRMALTIRPDQLSAQQLAQISGVLGINMEQGLQTVDVTASNAQIAQIQNILAPYPNTTNNGGMQQITTDSPNAAYPKPGEQNSYDFQGPLPTVRTFSRYLVILGCVCATIMMALAAYGMVLGQRDGAGRVLGTAAGFMMLLCGYTIWKIVQMNTFGAMSNTPPINQNRPTQATVGAGNLAPSTVPGIPAAGNAGRPARSPMPVAPLLGVPGN